MLVSPAMNARILSVTFSHIAMRPSHVPVPVCGDRTTLGRFRSADEIEGFWTSGKDIVLLHGVTSSGKTDIYIHLIQHRLEQGKNVLYLVPEIALTTQLTSRLQRVFGDRLIVYHSRLTDAEREKRNRELSCQPSAVGYQMIL